MQELAAASTVSYSHLLNAAEPYAFDLEQLIAKKEADTSEVLEIQAVLNRRLQVFEDIPVSLNDSQNSSLE